MASRRLEAHRSLKLIVIVTAISIASSNLNNAQDLIGSNVQQQDASEHNRPQLVKGISKLDNEFDSDHLAASNRSFINKPGEARTRTNYGTRIGRDGQRLTRQTGMTGSATTNGNEQLSNYSQPFDFNEQQDNTLGVQARSLSAGLPQVTTTASSNMVVDSSPSTYSVPVSYSYATRPLADQQDSSIGGGYGSNDVQQQQQQQQQQGTTTGAHNHYHYQPADQYQQLPLTGRTFISSGSASSPHHRLRASYHSNSGSDAYLPHHHHHLLQRAQPLDTSIVADHYEPVAAADDPYASKSVPPPPSAGETAMAPSATALYGSAGAALDQATDHYAYLAPPAAHHALYDGPRGTDRWAWPWTDVSNYYASPNAAATFKKHHHHHHVHPKHHEHHEMSKHWEHGITLGEIVCVAVAVVLGIIILGSPFFLLFLMLFNGGNLLGGGTQMGLIAPTAVQTAAGAGRRRRRKRDLSGQAGNSHGSNSNLNVNHAGHSLAHLFEQLSPFVDVEQVGRSFERLMTVKDDIERLVSKLELGDALKEALAAIGTNHKGIGTHDNMGNQKGRRPPSPAPGHDEMRRKKKK